MSTDMSSVEGLLNSMAGTLIDIEGRLEELAIGSNAIAEAIVNHSEIVAAEGLEQRRLFDLCVNSLCGEIKRARSWPL